MIKYVGSAHFTLEVDSLETKAEATTLIYTIKQEWQHS